MTILNEVFGAEPGAVRPGVGDSRRLPEATEGERKGAVMFGDEMIDEASRKVAVKVVARGERAGRTRSVVAGP